MSDDTNDMRRIAAEIAKATKSEHAEVRQAAYETQGGMIERLFDLIDTQSTLLASRESTIVQLLEQLKQVKDKTAEMTAAYNKATAEMSETYLEVMKAKKNEIQ